MKDPYFQPCHQKLCFLIAAPLNGGSGWPRQPHPSTSCQVLQRGQQQSAARLLLLLAFSCQIWKVSDLLLFLVSPWQAKKSHVGHRTYSLRMENKKEELKTCCDNAGMSPDVKHCAPPARPQLCIRTGDTWPYPAASAMGSDHPAAPSSAPGSVPPLLSHPSCALLLPHVP